MHGRLSSLLEDRQALVSASLAVLACAEGQVVVKLHCDRLDGLGEVLPLFYVNSKDIVVIWLRDLRLLLAPFINIFVAGGKDEFLGGVGNPSDNRLERVRGGVEGTGGAGAVDKDLLHVAGILDIVELDRVGVSFRDEDAVDQPRFLVFPGFEPFEVLDVEEFVHFCAADPILSPPHVQVVLARRHDPAAVGLPVE